MARPRSFEPSAVLDAAADEFRVHGFSGTLTEQVCEAAGVRRSSLYNTFTSKEELFYQALVRYTDVMTGRQEEVLSDPGLSGSERLWKIIELVVQEESSARKNGHAAGCMIVGTLMTPDVRSEDERVQEVLERDFDRRIFLLGQAAKIGQLDGSIRKGSTPEDIALLVVTLVSGLRVTAQAGVPPEKLLEIVRIGLGSVLI